MPYRQTHETQIRNACFSALRIFILPFPNFDGQEKFSYFSLYNFCFDMSGRHCTGISMQEAMMVS